MQFNLTLLSQQATTLLPFNYQYPLSAAIYKIIQKADSRFAAFLHNSGYGEGHKSFKLFTFSDLQTAFKVQGDRMRLPNAPVQLTVCFHVQQAAENFIKGLFIHQQLDIADQQSRASFLVQQVESMPTAALTINAAQLATVVLEPLSPMVAGRKNDRGHYDYRSPDEPDFTACLLHNWIEKMHAVQPLSEAEKAYLQRHLTLQVLHAPQPVLKRLITIKAGTEHETRIRGYKRFRLQATAPAPFIELALNAGLGLHNAQGMGCVGVVGVQYS